MQSSCLELEERGRVEGTRDARDSLYQKADARDYIRQRMQQTLYQTFDVGDYIRQ